MVYGRDIYKRVFVALKLPNCVLQQIQSINGYIDDRVVRKVKSSSFHLTLHFCGETEITQVKSLHFELMNHLEHLAPLKLKLEAIGFFPKTGNCFGPPGISKYFSTILFFDKLRQIINVDA